LKKTSNPEKKHGVCMISSSKLFPPEMCNRRELPLFSKKHNTTKQNKTQQQQQQQCSFKTQICLVFQLLSLADSNL